MRRTHDMLVIGLFLLAAPAGCGSSASAEMPRGPGAEEANQIWQTRCVSCHGSEGRGDGAAAAALNPRPRNFGEAAWQDATNDQQIERAIVQGGAAIGKSPLMAPNPDLAAKPEVVAALRQRIRALRD